jgi:galactokinase
VFYFSLDHLEAVKDLIDDVLVSRAYHMIAEESRILRAVDAIRQSNYRELGVCMNESHNSLRDNYEVSTAIRVEQSNDQIYIF